MPFDASKVPAEHADLFYHGKPGSDGEPVGLTDAQYDSQKADLVERGEWVLDAPVLEDIDLEASESE